MPIHLMHVDGNKAGLVESFETDRVRIGRQADNDVKFDPQKDLAVSGYHAEIYRDGNIFVVNDLKSRNGTFVNGHKIDLPTRLNEGDVLQFSNRGAQAFLLNERPVNWHCCL